MKGRDPAPAPFSDFKRMQRIVVVGLGGAHYGDDFAQAGARASRPPPAGKRFSL